MKLFGLDKPLRLVDYFRGRFRFGAIRIFVMSGSELFVMSASGEEPRCEAEVPGFKPEVPGRGNSATDASGTTSVISTTGIYIPSLQK